MIKKLLSKYRITYNAPVLGTGEVDVHLWVEQAGRSSVTYAFEVLSADHRTVHAAGQRVLVNLDPQTLEPAPLSDEMWDIAAPLLKPGVTRPTPA